MSQFSLVVIVCICFYVPIFIAYYALNAAAYYGMAKKRGYSKPWLAWAPFLIEILKGAVADDIKRRRGTETNYRILLIILQASTVFLSFITVLTFCVVGRYPFWWQFFLFLTAALYIIYRVFDYIVLHITFTDYVMNEATIYIVINIFIAYIRPFFILAIRNKSPISIYGQPAVPVYGYPPSSSYNRGSTTNLPGNYTRPPIVQQAQRETPPPTPPGNGACP